MERGGTKDNYYGVVGGEVQRRSAVCDRGGTTENHHMKRDTTENNHMGEGTVNG